MPKYTKQVAKAKALNITNAYVRNNFNQAALGKERGVTRQTINRTLQQKPVQDALQRYLSSEKLKEKLQKIVAQGLEAYRVVKVEAREGENSANEIIKTEDWNTRHKFWRDLMTVIGELKPNGEAGGVTVVNVTYGYRQKKKKD